MPQKLPPDTAVIRKRTTYEDLQMFSQVLNQIRVNHPDSVDSHELLMAAIEGMVHAADPHSFVIPACGSRPRARRRCKEGKLFPMPVEFEYHSGAPSRARPSPPARRRRVRTSSPATSSWRSTASPWSPRVPMS